MLKITKKEYDNISNDYKGVYQDFQGVRPDLKGKRTMLHLNKESGATELIFEGVHFIIID